MQLRSRVAVDGHTPTAAALIRTLAWEFLCAMGAALKKNVRVMAQIVIYFGECCRGNLRKCVFCCIWMNYCMNFNEIHLFNGTISLTMSFLIFAS